jgi:hypothetical protein
MEEKGVAEQLPFTRNPYVQMKLAKFLMVSYSRMFIITACKVHAQILQGSQSF